MKMLKKKFQWNEKDISLEFLNGFDEWTFKIFDL